jgi:outer membrane protein assembly factor BamB
MRYLLKSLFLCLIFLLYSGCADNDRLGADRWSQFHADGPSQGFIGVHSNFPVRQQWSTEVGKVGYSSPAIGNDGTIYIGNIEGELIALSPNDGSIKWTVSFPGETIMSSPATDTDGNIYIVSTREMDDDNFNSTLQSVDPNGNRRWSFSFPNNGWTTSSPKTWGSYVFIYAILDLNPIPDLRNLQGALLILSQTGDLVHEEIGNCRLDIPPQGGIWQIFKDIWDFITGTEFDVSGIPMYKYWGWLHPTVAIVDFGNDTSPEQAIVVVVDRFCKIKGFRWIPPNLNLLWEHNHTASEHSSPAVGGGGLLVIGRKDGVVLAYGVETGDKLWEYNAGEEVMATAAFFARPIYVAGIDNFYALESNGSLSKKFPFPGQTLASPAMTLDNVYLSTSNGFYTFSLDLSSYFFDSRVKGGLSSPAIGEDGTVYVVSQEKDKGYLCAYPRL